MLRLLQTPVNSGQPRVLPLISSDYIFILPNGMSNFSPFLERLVLSYSPHSI